MSFSSIISAFVLSIDRLQKAGLLNSTGVTRAALFLVVMTPAGAVAQTELSQAKRLNISADRISAVDPNLHLADRILQNVQAVGLEGSTWKFGNRTDKGFGEVSTQQIVRWGSWRGIIDRPAVWLSDGSWLAGEVSWSGKEQLTVQNRWLQVPPIPLQSVRGVVLTPAASLSDWIGLQQSLQAAQGEDDVVWLSDRRRLTGVVDWSSLEGNAQIKLNTSGQEIAVPLQDVVAIVASPALFDQPSSSPLQIGLSDGSLLSAREITSTENRAVISLASIPQIESLDRTNDFVKATTFLSYSNINKVQQLDQLKPASYRNVSDNQLEYALGVGRDVNGNPLQVGRGRQSGIVFQGLALHSSAQAAYRWDRSPGKFLAEVQLAPTAGEIGSVLCKVLVARGGNLQTATEFSLLHGDPAHLVDVDIKDAQLVVLVVEKADRGQFGDHVLWLDARFATK